VNKENSSSSIAQPSVNVRLAWLESPKFCAVINKYVAEHVPVSRLFTAALVLLCLKQLQLDQRRDVVVVMGGIRARLPPDERARRDAKRPTRRGDGISR